MSQANTSASASLSKPTMPIITTIKQYQQSILSAIRQSDTELRTDLNQCFQTFFASRSLNGSLDTAVSTLSNALHEKLNQIQTTQNPDYVKTYKNFLNVLDFIQATIDLTHLRSTKDPEEFSPFNLSLLNLEHAWQTAGGHPVRLNINSGSELEQITQNIMAQTTVDLPVRLAHIENLKFIYDIHYMSRCTHEFNGDDSVIYEVPEPVVPIVRPAPEPMPTGRSETARTGHSNFILQCLCAGVVVCAAALLLLSFAAPAVALSMTAILSCSLSTLKIVEASALVLGGVGLFALRRNTGAQIAAGSEHNRQLTMPLC